MRGGALPHTDTLIRTTACGRVQIGLFKTRRQCFVMSLSCFSPSSLSNSRTDDSEAGPLDSRLNIGWDKPSRRIQDFVKAVISQNQQRNDAFNLNAEPGDRWWEKGFPHDLTQQQRAAEISQEPRAPEQSHRTNTKSNTWHPRQRIGHFREHHVVRIRYPTCWINVKQVFQTKSLLLNCELIWMQERVQFSSGSSFWFKF